MKIILIYMMIQIINTEIQATVQLSWLTTTRRKVGKSYKLLKVGYCTLYSIL